MCLKVSYLPIFFIYYSKADEFFSVLKKDYILLGIF